MALRELPYIQYTLCSSQLPAVDPEKADAGTMGDGQCLNYICLRPA